MQTYATHRALPRGPYILSFLLIVLNLLWAGWTVVTGPGLSTAVAFGLGLALVITHYAARRSAQIVQDRVIRLEMRLRCERLGVDLTGLPLPFIIALRFAGDGELPALAAKARSGGFATPDALKQAITDWQEDTLRV
jgi:hypothetical protein